MLRHDGGGHQLRAGNHDAGGQAIMNWKGSVSTAGVRISHERWPFLGAEGEEVLEDAFA